MSASSHFMIPVSVAASRSSRAREPETFRSTRRTHAEWEELDGARRRASLLALLAIYTVGLAMVVLLYQGEDIGVLLSAFFAHAFVMAVKGAVAAHRTVTVPTRLGLLTVHSRARLATR